MAYLLLKIISGNVTGQNDSCQFTEQGGTIGRSIGCQWPLIDNDRFISKVHAQITFQNNQFSLIDTSTNGVFVNQTGNLLGKNNPHVLQPFDKIFIGAYQISVAEINVDDMPLAMQQGASQSQGSLLDLVMGEDNSAPSPSSSLDPLAALDSSEQAKDNASADLGLNELLSGNAIPPQQPYQPVPRRDDFHQQSQYSNDNEKVAPVAKVVPSELENSAIPDDWELSGVMPAVAEYQLEKLDQQSPEAPPVNQEGTSQMSETKESAKQPPITSTVEDILNIEIPASEHYTPATAPIVPEVSAETTPEPSVSVEPTFPENDNDNTSVLDVTNESVAAIDSEQSNNNAIQAASSQNRFLTLLYEKIGLPKEYLANIDQEAFAEDIATVLLSSTQGLMSLLNGRTVFKQESRLSLTSIQPRSNNPLKFSIDPVDTLEMLLLKKKVGYQSTKEAYDEAISDIQLHQMAFLSGLQATLKGVLASIAPENIESTIKEQGKGFMGLNTASQQWQLYKDKKLLLDKKISENLNEILSNYFADAYQAQIDNIRKNNQ